MAINQVFLGLFFIDMVIHLVGLFLPKKEVEEKITHITKPLFMPLLLCYYLIGNANIEWLVVGGIILGWVGDVSLMWPKKQLFFMLGLGSFLIGHVLYIVAFIQATQNFALVEAWVYVLIPVYLILFWQIYQFFKDDLKEMKIPVVVYMTLILLMSFTAASILSTTAYVNVTAPIYALLGSFLFIASDFLLANQLFKKPFKYDQTIIMATYLFAQWFILLAYL